MSSVRSLMYTDAECGYSDRVGRTSHPRFSGRIRRTGWRQLMSLTPKERLTVFALSTHARSWLSLATAYAGTNQFPFICSNTYYCTSFVAKLTRFQLLCMTQGGLPCSNFKRQNITNTNHEIHEFWEVSGRQTSPRIVRDDSDVINIR
jgi:hypothetical protein